MKVKISASWFLILLDEAVALSAAPDCTTSTPSGNLNKKSLSTKLMLYFAFLKLIVVVCSNASTIFITNNLLLLKPKMTLLNPAPSSFGMASTHLIF